MRAAAVRAARSASSRAASALAGGGDGGLDRGLRGVLGLRGLLHLRDQRVAAVALGEDAVLAAGGDAAQLAGAAVPDQALAGDGDAGEGVEVRELVDDEDVGEESLRERS